MSESQTEPDSPPLDDIEQLHLHPSMKKAGLFTISAGILGLMIFIQTYASVVTSVGYQLLIVGIGLYGFVVFGLGVATLKMRGWAARASFVLSSIGAPLACLWFAFCLLNGLISLLSMAWPWTFVASASYAWGARRVGRRADEARERLRDQGLSIG